MLSVTNFGAVGDGVTDDTLAIRAAAAALRPGSALYFPPPVGPYYKITGTIGITARGCTIAGDGTEYGTRIHMATPNTTALSVVPAGLDGTRNQTNLVRGLLITGPGGATAGRGVYGLSDVHLENVGISGFFDGLYWDAQTFYSRASGLFISNCVHGIWMQATNNCTVRDSRITGNFGASGLIGPVTDGIVLWTGLVRGLTNRIIDCSIEYFTGDGIRWNGGAGGELRGNYFETQQSSAGHAHVRLGETYSTEAIDIVGNYFQGDGIAGFDAITAITTADIALGTNKYGINGAIGVSAGGAGNSRWHVSPQRAAGGTFTFPADSVYLGSSGGGPGGAASGDLTGDWPNLAVLDDSHNHTAATVPTGGTGGALAHSYLGAVSPGATAEAPVSSTVYMKRIDLAAPALISSVGIYCYELGASAQVSSIPMVGIWSDDGRLLMASAGGGNDSLFPANDFGPDASDGRWLHRPLSYYAPAGTYWIGVRFTDPGSLRLTYDAGADQTHTPTGTWLTDIGTGTLVTTAKSYAIRVSVLS